MKNLSIFLLSATMAAVAMMPAPGRADGDAATLFQQANQEYIGGRYGDAVDHYLAVAREHGVSAALLYNLGNSYAELGKTGQAVVNYERALRLSPGDADVKANLEQVRKDAGLYRDNKPLYERLADLLGPDQWLLLAGIGLAGLAVTALAAGLVPGLPATAVRVGISCALLLITVVMPPAILGYRGWNDGVVVGEEARLLISPFAEAASTGTIRAGRLVRPEKTHDRFVLVRDETGRSGWLHRDQVASIAELPR
jgi:tetratricopeptide (TPR) repeat protein